MQGDSMKKLLCIIILSVMFSFLCFSVSEAVHKNAGTTGANFLKIGVGSRAVGMGSAYTGIADDVSAMYWNPAGLSRIKERQITGMYNSWLEDVTHQYLGYAGPLRKKSVFGIGITYLNVGDITKTDISGNANIGTFNSRDMAIGISYARIVTTRVSIGLTAKYISQELEEEIASGYAFDIGTLIKIRNNLDMGIVVQNMGNSMKFVSESDELPLNVKAGVGYKPVSSVLVALDVSMPNDDDTYISSGVEYSFMFQNISIAPRIGYNSQTDPGGTQAGIGFYFSKLDFDFAYAGFGDLGDTYQVSFTVNF